MMLGSRSLACLTVARVLHKIVMVLLWYHICLQCRTIVFIGRVVFDRILASLYMFSCYSSSEPYYLWWEEIRSWRGNCNSHLKLVNCKQVFSLFYFNPNLPISSHRKIQYWKEYATRWILLLLFTSVCLFLLFCAFLK